MSEILTIQIISSVQPKPTTGGEMLLHRHFFSEQGEREAKWTINNFDSSLGTNYVTGFTRKFIKRLQHTRLAKYANDCAVLDHGKWLPPLLSSNINPQSRGVVVTVAHGELWAVALRFAKAKRWPLVTFFHDWWPDIPHVHRFLRRYLEARLRFLYAASDVALCVSGGMLELLGKKPTAEVLYPIPARNTPAAHQRRNGRADFCVKYFGNLFEYGPMLEAAMRAFMAIPGLRLEVRGANPQWSSGFQEEMRSRGLWQGFAPRHELNAWLAEADAFLVPMSFAGDMERRMQTSFPSKLTEFAQFGKPLIVWGPSYCSAVRWAGNSMKALCVTEENPASLAMQVARLAVSGPQILRLEQATGEAANQEFNPDRLQRQFYAAIERAALTR